MASWRSSPRGPSSACSRSSTSTCRSPARARDGFHSTGVTPDCPGRIPLVLTERERLGPEARPARRRAGVREGPDRDRERDGAPRATAAQAGGGFYPLCRPCLRARSRRPGHSRRPPGRGRGALPLTGTLSGRVKGIRDGGQAEPRRLGDRRGGAVERESARAPGHRARAPGDGRPRRFHSSGARSRSGRDHAPPDATEGRWRGRVEVSSLAPFAALLGLPEDARLDGRLSAEASFSAGNDVNALRGEGTVSAARVTAYGRTLELRAAAPLKVENGKVSLERLTLAEVPRRGSAPGAVDFAHDLRERRTERAACARPDSSRLVRRRASQAGARGNERGRARDRGPEGQRNGGQAGAPRPGLARRRGHFLAGRRRVRVDHGHASVLGRPHNGRRPLGSIQRRDRGSGRFRRAVRPQACVLPAERARRARPRVAVRRIPGHVLRRPRASGRLDPTVGARATSPSTGPSTAATSRWTSRRSWRENAPR